ncbi:MAG: Clp protease ClpP [Treponema sp.]|nr:Clp protease ClpP [Treponema sp.]
MKQIFINKQIGSDFFSDGITADYVRSELAAATPNEDIQLVIDSPGGYVWDCIAIFNVIREFCRKHSAQRVNVYIQGIAMSCASVIALAAKSVDAANTISVEDNSIFMIHNAWTAIAGNEHDLRKAAENLAAIDTVIANTYTAVTGKSDKDIRAAMNAETFLYGKAIVEWGFADTVISSEKSDGKAADETAALASAKAAWAATQGVMEKAKDIAVQKIAAMAIPTQENTAGKTAAKSMEGCMTAEEFRAAHPDEYQKILDAGVQQERKRCSAHLKMGETAGTLETAAKFIRDGAAVADENVQTEYFEKRVANAAKTDRANDNVPPITTPTDTKNAGMDEALAAFDKAIGGAR